LGSDGVFAFVALFLAGAFGGLGWEGFGGAFTFLGGG
jgi:hypothetical protein